MQAAQTVEDCRSTTLLGNACCPMLPCVRRAHVFLQVLYCIVNLPSSKGMCKSNIDSLHLARKTAMIPEKFNFVLSNRILPITLKNWERNKNFQRRMNAPKAYASNLATVSTASFVLTCY